MTIARAVLATVAAAAGLAKGQVQSRSDGNAILREVGEKYAGAQKYELAATIQVSNRRDSDGAVVREKSIAMHVAFESPDKVILEDEIAVYSDGKRAWAYEAARNSYAALKRDDEMVRHAVETAQSTMAGFQPSAGAIAKMVREEKAGGAECYVIELHDVTTPPAGRLLWVDEKRMVIVRQEESLKTGSVTETTRAEYTTVRIDEPLPEGLFKFTPPEGAKEVGTF